MKEDANQGGTERAALPEARRWAVASPSLPIDLLLLCVLDQALCYDDSIKSADRLTH